MKAAILLLLLSCILVAPAYSLEEHIVLGREDNWQDTFLSGVKKVPGNQGTLDLVLKDGEYSGEHATDILLHFNTSPVPIDSGSYTILKNLITVSEKHAQFGSGTGVFQGEREGIVLTPEMGSLFYRGTEWQDFSIEFWLYPARLGDGETIFLWQGTDRTNEGVMPQEVRFSIRGRKLHFSFLNFFQSPQGEPLTITLSGTTPLIPRTWHHHILRFDSTTGLLEYALDGETDGITYTNSRGRENSIISVPRIGRLSTSNLILGNGYTGFIDEFRISRMFVEEPFIRRYAQKTGTAWTRIFDLGFTNSKLLKVDAFTDTPGSTALALYYRIGNDITSFQGNGGGTLPWQQFGPGDRFETGNRGRYVQLMVEFFPGGYGFTSPSVSEIEIIYEPDYPPSPPALFIGSPGDGEVTLSWNEVESPDVEGYLLYYGEKPGNYFGKDAVQGPSPIDVGLTTSATVQGLENGRLYYFSVAAYDSAQPPHLSEFSHEISARPSSLLRRPQ